MANPHAVWNRNPLLIRSKQIFPKLEQTPDISRGEERLAAEVALGVMHGELIPTFAQERAFETLTVLAKG